MRKRRYLTIAVMMVFSLALAMNFCNTHEMLLEKNATFLMNYLVSGKMELHKVDSKGIAFMELRKQKGYYFNPVYIAMHALYYYGAWKGESRDEYYLRYYQLNYSAIEKFDRNTSKGNFFNCANWFVDNIKIKEFGEYKYGVWEYKFPWEKYALAPPWVSGMAQGVALQVLSRAYLETHDEKYIKTAELALNSFFVPVRQGGVTYFDSESEWWFEEYASPTGLESRVLNGMEHALIGIHEYSLIARDEKSLILWKKGMNSLLRNIHRFDAGWWTDYDVLEMKANLKYHNININLTKKLYEISQEKRLLDVATQWSSYDKHYFVREFLLQKPNVRDWVMLAIAFLISSAASLIGYLGLRLASKKVFG